MSPRPLCLDPPSSYGSAAPAARRLKRDKVVKIARLGSCNKFVSKREKFIFDAFVDL